MKLSNGKTPICVALLSRLLTDRGQQLTANANVPAWGERALDSEKGGPTALSAADGERGLWSASRKR